MIVLFSLPFLSNAFIHYQAKGEIYEKIEDIPTKEAALILGAAVHGTELSDILKDRVKTGIELYEGDKVETLIMSGAEHEAKAMKDYASSNGVEWGDIIEDSKGFNTLASIENLDPETSVIIVSQTYHLPRALFMARHFGIDALGMGADRQPYIKIKSFKQREFVANAWAFFNLWLLKD